MGVISSQIVTCTFTTRNISTGARQDADTLPTGKLAVNGVDDVASVTVTKVTTNGSVGRYTAQVTLPALVTGTSASIVEIWITATVNSITDNAVVYRDTRQDAAFGDLATDYALASGVNVTQIVSSPAAALAHLGVLQKVYTGTVTGSPTTTTMIDMANMSPDDGWWNGRIILFGGMLQGEGTPITGWTAASHTYTFKALTRAPSINDPYVIV
jgi:hypothetical protein